MYFQTNFNLKTSKVKYVILINCGANINLVEILQPPHDMIFYIIDR